MKPEDVADRTEGESDVAVTLKQRQSTTALTKIEASALTLIPPIMASIVISYSCIL